MKKPNIGDFVHIDRYHRKTHIDTTTGIVLKIHTVEPIHDPAENAFVIRLLETQGVISEYLLSPLWDSVKVLCAVR